ncbi:MAG: hypothetical protein AAB036_12205 [Elusimicrobiota bacterium]
MTNYYLPSDHSSRRKALVFGLLGLVALLALEALLLRSFVRVDTRPPSWDQSIHLEIALDYQHALAAGRLADAWYLAPKPGMPPFPPLYHLLLMRSVTASDPAHAALWVNWFYLALLAVSIFALAWYFRPDETAVAAAVLFVASPGIQELYATQLVDLPLVALAAAAYWALIVSDEFMAWGPSLLFGFLHAAGMLHKWSFFSYMLPAYWIAFGALATRRSMIVVLSSAALSAALILPWYSAHLALLPSRLVQASADFAVPIWTAGAWGVYFKQASLALGPILWVLGSISLLAPQFPRRGRQGWILLAWFLSSYVFWTIVPNRQIRFLLPGLVPLGVAFSSTWPKSVTWSVVAFQLFGLLNYFGGWVGPVAVNLPYYQFDFFPSNPGAAQDWKTEGILRLIEAKRDPSRPITNVTLVANDVFFNAPTFHWTQRRLGLEHARMRGVNRRLCELSEFVLLKDPKVGPQGVVSGLPEAAEIIKTPYGWFRAAYEEIARWPLPDKNNAILFQQRRPRKKPYAEKILKREFVAAGKTELTNLSVRFGDWDALSGKYKTVGVTAGQVDVRGLILQRPRIELEGFHFVLADDGSNNPDLESIRLLRLDTLRIKSLDVGADELRHFLSARVKGLEVSELTLDGTISLKGAYKGRSVSAQAALELLESPRRLKINILSASIAGVSVPVWIFREIKELVIPLYPNPETPFTIDVPGLTIQDGRLSVP